MSLFGSKYKCVACGITFKELASFNTHTEHHLMFDKRNKWGKKGMDAARKEKKS